MSYEGYDAMLPYYAGFFDGEGCVSVHSRGRQWSVLKASISNTDLPVLEDFKGRFGGGIYRGSSRRGVKPWWKWEATSKAAANFLETILPYSKIKAEQIEVALEFQDTMGTDHNSRKPVTDDVLQLRESIRLRLKEMKK